EAIRVAREFASDDGFRLNPDKTVILAGRAVCCGRVAGSGSVSLAPESTQSVLQLEAPASGKDCARIAGILNAVAPCVPGLGAVAGRIAQASRKGTFKAMTPAEHELLEADVEEAAALVAAAQEVWIPTRAPGTRLILFHDASRDGFGWKLAEFQWPGPGPIPDALPEGAIPADDDPRLRTVALGSRATRGREKMYAAVDLELGGARVAYRACASLLGGSDKFVMVTDSRPWVLAFAADKVKPKFLRIILEVTSGANVQIVHCAGAVGNPLTDALSRSFHGRRATLEDCLPVYGRPEETPGTRLLAAGFGIQWPLTAAPLAATTTRAAARAAATGPPPLVLGPIALADDDSDDDEAGSASSAAGDTDSETGSDSDSGWDDDPEVAGPAAEWREDEDDDGEGTDGEGEDPVPVAAPIAFGVPGLGLLPRDRAAIVRRLPALRTTGEPLPAALHPDPARRYFAGRGRQDPGPAYRELLVEYHHSRGHVGTQAVRHALLAGGNDWPGMPGTVRSHCATCPSCQVWNTHAPTVNPYPVDIYADVTPGAHLCMDVTHMTASPDGFKMILCIMCVATRYKFAVPLKSECTEEICAALDLVLGINGPTARISCDNNVVFTGAAVAAVAARHGASVDTTSEYSKANRCELACKAIGDAVRKSATAAGSPLRWRVLLAQVVSDLNAAVTRIGALEAWISPAEAYMARCNRLALPADLPANPDLVPNDHLALRRRLDLIYTNDVVNVARAQAYSGSMARRRARYETARVVTVFPPGTLVLVHRHERAPKWRRRWEGPYVVLHRSRGGAYSLLNRQNKVLARRFIPQLLKRWRGPIEHAPGEEELHAVLQDRLRPDGSPEYLCSWAGYGQDQNTWEGTTSFDDLDFLAAYHASKVRPFLVASYISPSP
ncbi:MAG: DDE-type integrase/transposase/recombinase, partial [Gemmataceae bacterium]